MQKTLFPGAAALMALFLAGQAPAQTGGAAKHDHDHSHSHADDAVYKGYFEDSQIAARPLSDWQGDWQSVYPLLQDGTLDPVMAHKAEHGDKSAEDYRAYYETGYHTDVDRIEIEGENVTLHNAGGAVSGQYASDGHEVLTYKAGNRGVRYVFAKTGGDAAAPGFIQFSDHRIAPEPADHYHLYWGDDRAALLEEVTNWPTYYPAALSREQILHEMLAH
ncbi:ZinT family metal-binding protein [Pseudogemmobacter humi]|uniref:Metal-binding protein ZinT n=1 Tax=Pseudogemmobacter humi TaxID=2483812 RepID=A0A3P5WZP0_9RHOB|nr:metal-binding protein ZinT [Pseudogemmobacter humi]VDC27261.1 Metal-binding protein ZinT precursor [Pseudogemmobacter humi]